MSYEKDGEIHIDEQEASAGRGNGHVRVILAVSLFAAIALLSAIWIFGAFSQGDVEEEITMQANQEEVDGAEAGDIPVAVATVDGSEEPDIGTE
ncbi:hypothetical protein [Aurantiacibacter gangjinensis]|uniref:Uncharacterized protein n=1 Tax=Aurantiacibacter gangjinensis TaxID=502682 RepID=A0A0G9MRJ4_9SPHN|nr:hypothetical protein [Aurantiacibacter gangjinensis]APE28006.1 hypothetical protein BMF35_a1177 [Aurantiacibacter gangjinensis]KLE31943.1 hypothetical protein AAW01_10900 [Aurantiacibacter gangjinensis]